MDDLEEQLRSLRAGRAETYALASKELVQSTLGEAVLALLAVGQPCDRSDLLAWFDEAINAAPKSDLKRQLYEAARKTLLA